MVWAKLKGFPWWPGMVDYCPDSQVLFVLLLLILLGLTSNQTKQEQNRTSRSVSILCGDCCWSSHHKGSKCGDCSGFVSSSDDFWPRPVLTSYLLGTTSNQTKQNRIELVGVSRSFVEIVLGLILTKDRNVSTVLDSSLHLCS